MKIESPPAIAVGFLFYYGIEKMGINCVDPDKAPA